ncbi:MAG: preprotein translocase subunit SecE, partial [Clostridia bacterium]|nr:preprotein translocase subunit SecE [Clostridia bacterium]
QDKSKKEKKSAKKKMSEIFSELKKVSWPSFGTVVKSTCVVIAVVVICTAFLFGVDKLFSYLYDLLITVA